jgi:hypothetical protein
MFGNATTTAVVANLEASLTIRPLSAVALRAFGGVNYDSAVPGILSPTIAQLGFPPVGTAAGITFQNRTSYYAGGGMVVRFGQ